MNKFENLRKSQPLHLTFVVRELLKHWYFESFQSNIKGAEIQMEMSRFALYIGVHMIYWMVLANKSIMAGINFNPKLLVTAELVKNTRQLTINLTTNTMIHID